MYVDILAMLYKDYLQVIDMWTISFTKNFYDDLQKFLFSNAPEENGCFLLAKYYKLNNNFMLLVTDILKPKHNSWDDHSTSSLKPNSKFINDCVILSEKKKSSLIFVHTHPSSFHPSEFSSIDVKSNNQLFSNLSEILDVPIGSLVFSRNGICGVIFDKKLQHVSKIKISGNTLSEFAGVGFSAKPSNNVDEIFDRQAKALGTKHHKKLQNMTITIVGLGGTGSPLAVQLAKMGIKKIRLVDMDTIEISNIPRVYGSTESDIGKYKVDVLKKHMETFSKSDIIAINADVTEKECFPYLIDSDIIFSCTDNLTSRAILNDVSIHYFIPFIDTGCRIILNDDGSICQAIAKIQVVTPDSACLWCTGTLDGKIILQEKLPDSERKQLENEGYYETPEKQPSVIPLTTLTACIAINKLFNLLGIYGEEYDTLTQIELKDNFMLNSLPKIKENCVCRKNRGNANLIPQESQINTPQINTCEFYD